jgi:hypothetical protein
MASLLFERLLSLLILKLLYSLIPQKYPKEIQRQSDFTELMVNYNVKSIKLKVLLLF